MTGRSMVAYQEGYSAGERAGRTVARDQIDALVKALELCKGALEACTAIAPDNRGIRAAYEAARDTLANVG
jgi:antirestriction protein